MANVLPNVPTDSLYKFVAIFGIVLLVFGLWLPEKFAAASNHEREAYKARQLAHIRVERKKVRSDRATEEFQKKSAALGQKLDALRAESAALGAKAKALADELNRTKASPNASVAKDILHRADAIIAQLKPIQAKIDQNAVEQQALDEEFKPLHVQLEEVADDLEAENVELKNYAEATKEFNQQADWWLEISAATLLIGVVMVGIGFRLWYVRVQIFQDAILRREAGVSADKALPPT